MAVTGNTLAVIPNNILPTTNEIDDEVCEPNLELSTIPSNSTINVENSNDVVFGNITQFHGSVTIYQSAANNTRIESNTDNQDSKYYKLFK